MRDCFTESLFSKREKVDPYVVVFWTYFSWDDVRSTSYKDFIQTSIIPKRRVVIIKSTF